MIGTALNLSHKPDISLLKTWDRGQLKTAILGVLEARFGSLPDYGIIAGQAVASACFEILGLGIAPMNDLDVFTTVTSDSTPPASAFILNGAGLTSRSIRVNMSMCSFSDNLSLEVLNKGGYRIAYTGHDAANPDINIIGCSPAGLFERVTPECLLDGFDLNLCEIAIDMETDTLYWTPAFEDFLYQREIKITRLITPIHSALRLLKKTRAMPQFTCNLTEQLRILKMGRYLGQLCEPSEKGYLTSQLLSQYSVDKSWALLASLSGDFEIRNIDVELSGDGMGQPDIKRMYTLDVINLSADDKKRVQDVRRSFCFNGGLSSGVDAYQMESDLLLRFERGMPSKLSILKYDELTHLVQSEDATVSISKAAYERTFGRRVDISAVKRQIRTLIHYLLARHKAELASIEARDVKNIMRLIVSHPNLFMSYLASCDDRFDDMVTAAKNIRYLDKHGYYFVVGIFETKSDDMALFPPLNCRQFKRRIHQSVEVFKKAALGKTFTGIADVFGLLDTRPDVEVRELTNQWEFIEVGSKERHCVGGYYDICKDNTGIILHVTHKVTGACATGYYYLSADSDEFKGEIITAHLSQYYGKENSRVRDELRDCLRKKVSITKNKLPVHAQGAFERVVTDLFTQDIPF